MFVYVGATTPDPKGAERSAAITVLDVDLDSGSMAVVQTVDGLQSPTYLALHPTLPVLYAGERNWPPMGPGTPGTGGITSLRIDATHPSLPGHFPGDPIVPGVVLLDRVAACLEQAGYGVAKLSTVKFLAPLRPGEDATLRFDGDAQRLRFRVERAGTPILSGEAVLA